MQSLWLRLRPWRHRLARTKMLELPTALEWLAARAGERGGVSWGGGREEWRRTASMVADVVEPGGDARREGPIGGRFEGYPLPSRRIVLTDRSLTSAQFLGG